MDYTPTDLAMTHVAFSVFALGLLIYHLRKFRSDALLRLHALVKKKAVMLTYVHELYAPIMTIYESNKNMMEELGEEMDENVMQTMSNTMNAVSTAAGTLHNLATQQLQDDGLPPMSNDMISAIQQYSQTLSENRRVDRRADPSSVYCSIDSWSEHVTRGSTVDRKEEDKREGDGKCGEERERADYNEGYREGPSWGVHISSLSPAEDTIVDDNDDDVEMACSSVSELDRSMELQASFHEQEMLQEQWQEQHEQWELEQEQVVQQQLQQAIQEELGRREDRTTLMSDITAGTLRSARHQAQGFLKLRLCDAL